MCPRRGFILRALWLPGNRKLWPAFVVAIGIFGRYAYIRMYMHVYVVCTYMYIDVA